MVRKSSAILDPRERAELRELASRLRKTKPIGWSVVFSENELVVRPAYRSVGKFSVSFSGAKRVRVAFFSRGLNYWNKSAYFGKSGDVIAKMWNWMTAEVLAPTERRKPDDEARLS